MVGPGVKGRPQACVTCSRRKKRCDLQRPSCGQCRKSCIPCGGYNRGPKRSNAGNSGASTSNSNTTGNDVEIAPFYGVAGAPLYMQDASPPFVDPLRVSSYPAPETDHQFMTAPPSLYLYSSRIQHQMLILSTCLRRQPSLHCLPRQFLLHWKALRIQPRPRSLRLLQPQISFP
uniref:Zn(2)-C6 fungal-type domain-containing protein n=1 Tax=Bionectria ochroleuca TaxID=29856 RepID=A0A8H7NGK1_BIOOC